MPTIATGSKTIVDLSDGKSLSVYIGSNQPRTQINDVNANTYTPNWTSTAGKLVLTPVIYANQTAVPLTDANLAITWKRKDGSSSEAALTSGETVSNKTLTVNVNKLAASTSGMLTYIAYVTYTDPDTGLPINAQSDISFALVKTGQDAKSAWIGGEQVFKYTAAGAVSPAQITLTANLQNVTMSKWQYKNSTGSWVDYPTTSDNANITSATLIVKPTHAVFVGQSASLRIVTSDSTIGDTTSIYKVQDGADGATGAAGAAGAAAVTAFLTNENITFAANRSGQVAATTKTCNVVAYKGTTKVTPTVGTISGAPTGMTITVGEAANNEIPLTITVAANSNFGSSAQLNGEILVPITAPVATTLKIQWSKVNTGASGTSAVLFHLYAPDGNIFTNGAGSLTIKTQAYNGTTAITSGATYKWEKYGSGAWTTLTGETGSSLTVAGSTVTGLATYRCTMTYSSKTYVDTITLEDKTDNYQASIDSTGGDIFKNTVGTSTLTCRLFQNGKEVDMDGSAHTYTWYRRDKDGNTLDDGAAFATGKSISIDGDDVDVKTTFICEVS